MTYRLRYTPVDASECDWTEELYHESVPVRKGIAYTDDPVTVQILTGNDPWYGFLLIEEDEPESAPSSDSAPAVRRTRR